MFKTETLKSLLGKKRKRKHDPKCEKRTNGLMTTISVMYMGWVNILFKIHRRVAVANMITHNFLFTVRHSKFKPKTYAERFVSFIYSYILELLVKLKFQTLRSKCVYFFQNSHYLKSIKIYVLDIYSNLHMCACVFMSV